MFCFPFMEFSFCFANVEFNSNFQQPALQIPLNLSDLSSETFTGLYTKWDSFTPRKYKINLIRTLTYRCFRICSSPSLLQAAIKDLKKLLLQNGYPQGVITFNINDVLNKNKNKPNNLVQATVFKKDILIVLPYLGLHNNQITKRLKFCVYNFYSFVNLNVIFQNTRRYFSYKDRLSRSQRSKVIYKAGCWNCDEFYISIHWQNKTKTPWQETEHFKALAKSDHSSAIADHVKTTGHDIKWDHFDILASGKTDFHRKITERDFVHSRAKVLVVRRCCFISYYCCFISYYQHRITYCCRSFFSV